MHVVERFANRLRKTRLAFGRAISEELTLDVGLQLLERAYAGSPGGPGRIERHGTVHVCYLEAAGSVSPRRQLVELCDAERADIRSIRD